MDDNDRTRTAGEENVNPAEAVSEAKGKGKAAESVTQNMSMDEDDDSSDEETGAEEDVGSPDCQCLYLDVSFLTVCIGARRKYVCEQYALNNRFPWLTFSYH